METVGEVTITYQFKLDSGDTVVFPLRLDERTLTYQSAGGTVHPDWTHLDYEPRCDHCPLRSQGAECCPIALNLADVVSVFKDTYSFETADCTVVTRERVYAREAIPIQSALSSLLGIIMVTSGCPDMDKLRPMVKFHLPFASIEETTYRAASMYLLAQYFRQKHGLQPDIELKGLIGIYRRIDHLNSRLCQRLRTATNRDASLNAVVVLDVFAKMIPMSVEETLSAFESLFDGYISG